MTDYNFTRDWFSWAPDVWAQLLPLLPGRKDFLEIGSFEGRSAVWVAENFAEDGARIVCVDTWEGGEEHTGEDMPGAEGRFHYNVATLHAKFPDRRIEKIKNSSYKALAALALTRDKFDFIYIDGSHAAKDVLTDACMAWPLLKPGGVMVFDDYLWGGDGGFESLLRRPKLAVDAFVNLFADEVVYAAIGYQMAIQKRDKTKR